MPTVKCKKSFFIIFLSLSLFLASKAFSLDSNKLGGGYAVTGQIARAGYTSQLYDASNGLPTSDANFILGSTEGYIWIGGYSGIIRYDGSVFERLSSSNGLTSARALFEDSSHRIWVGTNDNGVVVIEGEKRRQYTYKDGLPSSSIRIFAEDFHGNVFIGTTSGIAYVDSNGRLYHLYDDRINDERVLKLDTDKKGKIYGQTKSGKIFLIEDCKISACFTSKELGFEAITSLLADPLNAGKLYLCTEESSIYYGDFGKSQKELTEIPVSPLKNIHWISYDCGRVWLSSTTTIGYLDENKVFQTLSNIPLTSSIEMHTSDYQGNIWVASSTQGIMKVVANNFVDITESSGLLKETTNATCLHGGKLYIGTDNGLRIINDKNQPEANALTDFIGSSRVRCIEADKEGNLWIATYTNHKGLVCQKTDGSIISFTTENGLLNNQVRCLCVTDDGRILAGTNGGLVIIKDCQIQKTYGSEAGIKNTEILTVAEGEDDSVYCGTDGDGLYIINQNSIKRLGRDDGLSSDVVMRIKKDRKRRIFWVITSNSFGYIKNGVVKEVSSFPYNNNYDFYFNDYDELWILSSYGIFTVNIDYLLYDYVKDYKLYTIANGLPYTITSNSYSALDKNGNLYISGREGVIRVNINKTFDASSKVKIALNSIYCDDKKILPNAENVYSLPASDGRIKLSVSVMDYSMWNPTVRVFLEGSKDSGITVERSALSTLEYTGLGYGNYNLHVQILDNNNKDVLTEKSFAISKKPRLRELFVIRFVMFLLVMLIAGFIVWRFMKSTVVRRQYNEIRLAKEDAERANTAKSRFLSNMSQEILTPLNTIMGMDEMIMREDAKSVPKSYFMSIMNYAFAIRSASESLSAVISDILEISKIESGSLTLVQQEYDVQEMLRSVIAPVRKRSMEKHLQFDVVIDNMMPRRLYGDLGKIRQVLFRLLFNAVKYTNEGGLELKLSMVERVNNTCGLCFTVKDTGIGIKPEEMEEIFAAYGSAREGEPSEHHGTGLGLDISRKFAELMGGVLVCRSTYGEGSEFIFTLSQKILDASPLGNFLEEDDGAAARGPYIPQFISPDADVLVVDSNEMNQSVIKNLLRATKVFVTTSVSAKDCLEKIRGSSFNVVFIAQSMLKKSETDLIENIREIDKKLPVYVISESTETGEDYFKSLGFNGSITSPIDALLLERIIMLHLPEEMMEKPQKGNFMEALDSFPPELTWLQDTPGLNIEEGIKASGGIGGLIFGIKLFYDTIDENLSYIETAYKNGDFKLYEVKISLLKNSARLIGALDLLKLATQIESACSKKDMIFIASHTEELLQTYAAYKEKLARLESK